MNSPGTLALASDIPVIVSNAVESNPDWWVRPHWWLDEDFRRQINGSLFQAFGHRAHPPFYLVDPAVSSLIRGAPRNGRPKQIITNEIGAKALEELTRRD